MKLRVRLPGGQGTLRLADVRTYGDLVAQVAAHPTNSGWCAGSDLHFSLDKKVRRPWGVHKVMDFLLHASPRSAQWVLSRGGTFVVLQNTLDGQPSATLESIGLRHGDLVYLMTISATVSHGTWQECLAADVRDYTLLPR